MQRRPLTMPILGVFLLAPVAQFGCACCKQDDAGERASEDAASASAQAAEPTADDPTPASPDGAAARAFPPGIDPANTSDDETYGYTSANPVMLGDPDLMNGPRAERVYLEALRDEAFQPIRFTRLGSGGGNPDGHIVDHYQLTTSTGETIDLYIDMYHGDRSPLDQKAPKGMFIQK